MPKPQAHTTTSNVGGRILQFTGLIIGCLIGLWGLVVLFTIIFAAMKMTGNLEWTWFSFGFSPAVFIGPIWAFYISIPTVILLVVGANLHGNPEQIEGLIKQSRELGEKLFKAGKPRDMAATALDGNEHADYGPYVLEGYDNAKAYCRGRVDYRNHGRQQGGVTGEVMESYDKGFEYEKTLDGPTEHVWRSREDISFLCRKFGLITSELKEKLDGGTRDIALHQMFNYPQIGKVWKFTVTGKKHEPVVKATQVDPNAPDEPAKTSQTTADILAAARKSDGQ
jgi:hypothetical protein